MQKLIQFDVKESDLMYNTELFPLKRQVNQKIYTLFEQIKSGLKDTAQHKQFIFPTGTDSETGKISQGENYLSYPWVILDFPKLFNKHEIFAFRTLFWYGHCLLYTSDAADERSSVDLGGRRIIKKKKNNTHSHPYVDTSTTSYTEPCSPSWTYDDDITHVKRVDETTTII